MSNHHEIALLFYNFNIYYIYIFIKIKIGGFLYGKNAIFLLKERKKKIFISRIVGAIGDYLFLLEW